LTEFYQHRRILAHEVEKAHGQGEALSLEDAEFSPGKSGTEIVLLRRIKEKPEGVEIDFAPFRLPIIQTSDLRLTWAN